ncbi:RrF2 family transcriptional regulator [Aeoliella mucimassa]|uniref:HTH-type transcriptional regulator CymR n=1 Tax=Aeoliella mucimassa TaxID=2527972 RepID=A0A518ASC0_9BACT|nr:Rrf2 family transcriptional regulator [Aeoliella mucimassa]QDU57623.1 HTH-type transcriptional regulator CymR [Aeoliella mucimassa]
MKLSAKTEYGSLAMLHLAEHYPSGEPVQIRKVAADHDIPWRFLVQILLELKRAGLVTSTRGAAGGYRLARTPDAISLGEVFEALEGSDSTDTDQPPPTTGYRGALHSACRDAHTAQRERLRGISLTDLLECAAGRRAPMWYI